MKFADIDVDVFVEALGKERSEWIKVTQQEGRQHTEAERVTICILAALERKLKIATTIQRVTRPIEIRPTTNSK